MWFHSKPIDLWSFDEYGVDDDDALPSLDTL